MNTWTPLFSKIVDSSVWTEPDNVVKVFLTMMALKDADQVVRYNAFAIGQRAHKTEEEVLEALEVLSAPDKKRIEPQPHEGRRVEKVDGGWLLLNGQYYEDLMRSINRRAYKAGKQREYRARGKPLAGEVATLKHEGNGDQAAADRAAEASLPESARGLPGLVPPGGEDMDPEAARKLAAHLEAVRAERELKAKAGEVRAVPVGLAPVPVVAAVGAAVPVLPAAGPVSIEEALRRGAAAAAVVPVKPTAANPLAAGWAEQIKAVAKEGGQP